MLYRKDKYGNELSMLGFGCMRFTKKGNNIDLEKAEKEIMAAYRAGVNYFDTAYIYPGSEAAIGEIFERNHIRDKINIATKLPQYMIRNRSGLDKYFDEELVRLRTNYVDYYLMHHLTDLAMWEKLKKVGFWPTTTGTSARSSTITWTRSLRRAWTVSKLRLPEGSRS